MKLTTRSRYGTKLMLELALRIGEGPVLLREIASSQQVSEKYLGNLIISLKGAGLIGSVQGAHGGYYLARKPEEVAILEIVQVMEGSITIIDCLEEEGCCEDQPDCFTQQLWRGLQEVIDSYLGGITLADIVEQIRKKDESEYMYFI